MLTMYYYHPAIENINSDKTDSMKSDHLFENTPFVSVLIPFLNNPKNVESICYNLKKQSYPQDRYEVILIDNGSDEMLKIIETDDPLFRLISENERKGSPYSARNRGLEIANGEITAFIDANSRPESDWLEKGVRCMIETESDLIAGQIRFDFGDKMTASKIVDSMTSIQVEKAVKERGVAYTANLFVRSDVFKKAGKFDEGIRSGGDVRFSENAKRAGYKISYCQGAVVNKYARGCKALYKKKIRTGKGYFYTWKDETNRTAWFYNLIRAIKPPDMKSVNQDFENKVSRFQIWMHLYATGIVEQLAFVYEYFKVNLGGQRDLDRGKVAKKQVD